MLISTPRVLAEELLFPGPSSHVLCGKACQTLSPSTDSNTTSTLRLHIECEKEKD